MENIERSRHCTHVPGHFTDEHFCRHNIFTADILSGGHFADRTFLPTGHFAERKFNELTIC